MAQLIMLILAAATCLLAVASTEHASFNKKLDNVSVSKPEDDIGEINILPGSTKCYCANDNLCACCDTFVIPKLKLNNTGCFELIYLPQDFGISLIFEIDNHILMNKTVSARNPPPVCYDIPDLSFAALCVQLFNLEFQQKTLTGCARGLAELEGRAVYKKDIGCFRLPMKF